MHLCTYTLRLKDKDITRFRTFKILYFFLVRTCDINTPIGNIIMYICSAVKNSNQPITWWQLRAFRHIDTVQTA